MPTSKNRIEVLLDDKELKALKRAAKPMTLANYFRKLAGLPPLQRGAAARKRGKGK
jgi:hypothetical protein